jgi:hypothetical protein
MLLADGSAPIQSCRVLQCHLRQRHSPRLPLCRRPEELPSAFQWPGLAVTGQDVSMPASAPLPCGTIKAADLRAAGARAPAWCAFTSESSVPCPAGNRRSGKGSSPQPITLHRFMLRRDDRGWSAAHTADYRCGSRSAAGRGRSFATDPDVLLPLNSNRGIARLVRAGLMSALSNCSRPRRPL